MANPSQQFMMSLDGYRPDGGHLYNVAGTHSWLCPTGVKAVDVVCIGGGGNSASGGGGGLGYKNSITVTAGTTYTVVVGRGGFNGAEPEEHEGLDSYFLSLGTVKGGGGGDLGGTFTGDGGGAGGLRGTQGGSGAGGYSGTGGVGHSGMGGDGTAGSGGAGGGGAGGFNISFYGGGGGGVGVYGSGSNGAGGIWNNALPTGGGGGSGGNSGSDTGTGGLYGGGAGTYNDVQTDGAVGAVRIIWGTDRAFPSTNVTQDYAGETEGLN